MHKRAWEGAWDEPGRRWEGGVGVGRGVRDGGRTRGRSGGGEEQARGAGG